MIKKPRVLLTLLFILMMVTTAVWLLADENGIPVAVHGYITEYEVGGAPQSLVVAASGPPATIWFTMPDADAIGRLIATNASSFSFATFTTGITANSAPHDLVYDAANNLIWFTEPGNASLGRFDIGSSTVTNEFALPGSHVPLNLDIAPNGLLYITSPSTSTLLSFNPGTTTFTPYAYFSTPANSLGNPTHVTVQNNDSVWITSPATEEVAEFKVSTLNFVIHPVRDYLGGGFVSYTPTALTFDSAEPWIAASSVNRIGRYAEGTLSFWRWYPVLPNNAGANALDFSTSGTANYIWYANENLGQVGRMTLNAANYDLLSVSAHALSAAISQPTDIAVDGNGIAWITGKGSNVIAQWIPPYAEFTNLPLTLKP